MDSAEEAFSYYLNHRPSVAATNALKKALKGWTRQEGASQRIERAIGQIPVPEDLWHRWIGRAVFWAFYRDDRLQEGVALIERIAQDAAQHTPLLFELAKGLLDVGQTQQALAVFRRIVALDETQWWVELQFAEGYIREVHQLNPGQPAPGFAKDADLESVRAVVKREGIQWPQICEGKNWASTAFRLYNITGLPRTYILAPDLTIATKKADRDHFEEIITSLQPTL